MKFNSGVEEASKVGSFDSSRIITMKSLKRGVPYKFRLLEPVVPVNRVLYPCVVEDRETREIKQSWRGVNVPLNYAPYGWVKETTVLDALYNADLEIRQQLLAGTTDKAESFFRPQKIWVFPVFDRQDSSDEITIKFLEAGWTIFEAVRALSTARDVDDQSKLRFGPHWVHDVIIEKTDKYPNKPGLADSRNTTYTVTAAKKNEFEGVIPASILEKRNVAQLEELYNQSVEHGIFTQDEKIALDMFSPEAELLPPYTPFSNASMMDMLTKFPVCLDAKSKDGLPVFPDPVGLLSAFKDIGLAAGLLEAPAQEEQQALPSPKKKVDLKVVEETEVVEESGEEAAPKAAPLKVAKKNPVPDQPVAAPATPGKKKLGFLKDLG